MSAARPFAAHRALRFLLWLLMNVSAVLSALALLVGLGFGFNLWRWDRPWVTVAWLTLVLLPLAVYRAVQARHWSTARLAVFLLVAWTPPVALLMGA